jgi:hypothetical protein
MAVMAMIRTVGYKHLPVMQSLLISTDNINGTAESIATSGLVWTLAPFGIFIGLNLGKFYCGILICIKGNVKAAVK